MKKLKKAARFLLKNLNVSLIKYSTLERLLQNEKSAQGFAQDIELILAFPNGDCANLLKYLRKSKSQLRQDLFVLSHLKFKTNGFFVEFGATNGVDLSNTWLLEKEFEWKGILAEPAKCWHKQLKKNRTASLETNCVWKDSHSTLTFNEVEIAELSTIQSYSDNDLYKDERKQGTAYDVKTISLNELLIKHRAPEKIDYLSIDTEGSEFEILNNFDFSKHSFQIITCEHNFTLYREKIFDLLSKNGYRRVYKEMSGIDDWYVKSD
jgi:FkbM family methyltransferase